MLHEATKSYSQFAAVIHRLRTGYSQCRVRWSYRPTDVHPGGDFIGWASAGRTAVLAGIGGERRDRAGALTLLSCFRSAISRECPSLGLQCLRRVFVPAGRQNCPAGRAEPLATRHPLKGWNSKSESSCPFGVAVHHLSRSIAPRRWLAQPGWPAGLRDQSPRTCVLPAI